MRNYSQYLCYLFREYLGTTDVRTPKMRFTLHLGKRFLKLLHLACLNVAGFVLEIYVFILVEWLLDLWLFCLVLIYCILKMLQNRGKSVQNAQNY